MWLQITAVLTSEKIPLPGVAAVFSWCRQFTGINRCEEADCGWHRNFFLSQFLQDNRVSLHFRPVKVHFKNWAKYGISGSAGKMWVGGEHCWKLRLFGRKYGNWAEKSRQGW